jgi:hypothetical protein
VQVYLEAIAILSVCYITISYLHFVFTADKVNNVSTISMLKEKRSLVVYILFFIVFIDIFWGVFFIFSKLFLVSQVVRNMYISSQIGMLLLLQLAKVRVYE